MSVGLLTRLADALGIEAATLLTRPAAEDPERAGNPADDVAALGAVLHGVGVLIPEGALRSAPGWDLARLDAALAQLDEEVGRVGLRLVRNPAGYTIGRSVEACEQDTITRALRAHIARDGLNVTEASLLRRIGQGQLAKELGNADTVALGVLTNAELITHGEDGAGGKKATSLAEAVRFSLMLDEHPQDPLSPTPGPEEAATQRRTPARALGAAWPDELVPALSLPPRKMAA